jgi:hypothetical protein
MVKLDRKIALVAALVTVAAARNVGAQSAPPAEPPAESPDTPERAVPPPSSEWRPRSGFGMTLAGGAGVTDFTQGSTRGVTETGGSWAVRFAFLTRRLLGFEVSYVGGANTIRSLGFDRSATLIRNGIEGILRVNAPLTVKGTLLEPYIAGGAGWNAYHITGVETATSSVSLASQSALSVPLAFGFAVGYRGFIADARYTVRPTYGQTTLHGDGGDALTNWDVGAMVGYEF